jgi:hypothetical protein
MDGSVGDSQTVRITEEGEAILCDALNDAIEQGREAIHGRLAKRLDAAIQYEGWNR